MPLQRAEQSRRALYREAVRAAAVGLVINLLLGVTKLTAGLLSGFYALISDAVNSLSDVGVSTVVVGALLYAQRPADSSHPYGHSKAEGIAASNVALLVVVSAAITAYYGILEFGAAHGLPPFWTLLLAGGNVAIKELLYHYKIRVGRRTGSTALIANAWDHRSDALCAAAVLVGLLIVRIGGLKYAAADEIAAFVVLLAIIVSAGLLFRRSVSELMDVQADSDLVSQIRREATEVGGVVDVETLLVRKSGLEYFVDVHIEVDARISVADGHEIGHRVKDRLLGQLPVLRDVLVHLEPDLQRDRDARSARRSARAG
ncbi:MAG: cation transporter [Deltaproteobacteria bacterium]|nr:cation transporter [Deltaproteobacteria bacterium]